MQAKPQSPVSPQTVVPGNVILGALAFGAIVAFVVMVVTSRRHAGDSGRSATVDHATIASTTPAPATTAATAEPPSAAAESKWIRTKQSQWATDGSRTIGFELTAERDVPVYMDRVRPILAARCISRHIQMFVVLRSATSIETGGDAHTVLVRVDDEAPVSEQWVDSSDKQALFSPDGGGLAKRLASARRLQFGFTPFNAPAATADFDVRGFDAPLAAMTRTCAPPLPTRRR